MADTERSLRQAKAFIEHDDRLKTLEKYGIYKTLDQLKNAVADTGLPYSLVTNGGRAEYSYVLGDFTNKDDNVNVIKLNAVQIKVGALILQAGKTISHASTVPGSPIRDVSTARNDFTTSKDLGALANGTGDDGEAIARGLALLNDVTIVAGNHRISKSQIGELQKPISVKGVSHDSKFIIDNPDDCCWRLGAVGGNFGDFRAQTRWQSLTFQPKTNRPAPYSVTAIDVQAVFPIAVEDCTFLGLGADALKGTSLYYGYLKGCQYVNSGVTFNDVNSVSLFACEFRADDRETSNGGEGQAAGKPLFGNINRYPLELIESDQIKMYGGLFEGWSCPFILLRRSYNIVFNGVWFEGNISNTHCIKLEQAQSVDFINCQLDFAIPYSNTGSFISVVMAGPLPNSENVNWRPYVRISGGYLLLTSVPHGDAGRLISVSNTESPLVEISGLTFKGGNLWGDRTVEFNVKSILLSGALKHSFYSRPNATLLRGLNNWLPQSVNTDWDFSNGAGFISATFGVGVSTTDGDFLTGTRSAKMTGLLANSTQRFSRNNIVELGKVDPGQTYVVYARLKVSTDCQFKITIDSGGAEYGGMVYVPLKAGEWYDFVLKTDRLSTQELASSSNPNISFNFINESASGQPAASVVVDRFDYAKITGDHII